MSHDLSSPHDPRFGTARKWMINCAGASCTSIPILSGPSECEGACQSDCDLDYSKLTMPPNRHLQHGRF
ncbi:uncharacterized protein L3040_005352 [Drepanopeziza brunnea f. sp. 'multigermtubi']|uniref:uncharacterized protein n=1 Tax=Drepanopeziza brunnea f. sp. 'multigermtubi' TaxID=698441 RepID=UPI00239CF702|nr:hypothetical protein L3040_005352 [Drepanopeziza brunnea f. sp. 'multigermtubi']